MNSLEEIADKVRQCTDCPLWRSRTRAVPGEGPSQVKLVFVGEAPGFYEDQEGRPFVGAAGRFLSELLTSIGLRREDVYITNTVKCRPPNNRDPLPGEMDACKKYLDRQIELLRPRLVVTLGRHSMARFLPRESITRVRGKPRKVGIVTVYPMLHPAAALHQQSLRSAIEEDFRGLRAFLDGKGVESEDSATGSQQLPMF